MKPPLVAPDSESVHRPETAPAYTRAIEAAGQHAPVEPDTTFSPPLDDFLTRVLAFTDDDRRAIAEARKAVDESFHQRALLAASELLRRNAVEYVKARTALAAAHVPGALDGELGAGEVAELNDVARHVQLAIDDGLIAILTSDLLHPNHARELYRSLKPAFDH